MLGVTQRYFESVAGIPIRKFKDTYHFVVERCNVQAFIKDEDVLRLELTPRCQADLSSFGFNRSTRGLTFLKILKWMLSPWDMIYSIQV